MVKFEEVSFRYPKFKMEGLNFEIGSGEIVAVVGENASGKTTLLNLMAGLISPKSGKVTVFDEKPTCGKNIGIVFQNPDNQVIFSKVEDDINFTLKNQKVPKSEWKSRVAEVLSQVGLSGYENHDTGSLSGGQKQRLVIANMLAIKSKLIVLDEASVYLDTTAKQNFFSTLFGLKNSGLTIVFSTNNLEEILYADRVMVLDDGKITAFLPRTEILKQLSIFKEAKLHIPLNLKIIDALGCYNATSEAEILAEITRRTQ